MTRKDTGRFILCIVLIMIAGWNATTYTTLFQPIPQALCLFGTFAAGLWAATIAYGLILREF